MDVTRSCETACLPHRLADAAILEECDRHREPEHRQPGDCRQDEEPDEQPHRQEDEHSDAEGVEHRRPRNALTYGEPAGTDVGEGEEGSGEDEQARLHRPVGAHCELVEYGDRKAERERAPETPAVEPDRIRDQLSDCAFPGWEAFYGVRAVLDG